MFQSSQIVVVLTCSPERNESLRLLFVQKADLACVMHAEIRIIADFKQFLITIQALCFPDCCFAGFSGDFGEGAGREALQFVVV